MSGYPDKLSIPRASLRYRLPRLVEQEWLDQGLGSHQDVQTNLREMQQINHWLGGNRALYHHLLPRLKAAQQQTRVLDLGTGSGAIPAYINAWASRRGLPVLCLAVDWSSRNLAAAQQILKGQAVVPLLQADAQQLPFSNGAVDWVISSMFLHHFEPDAVAQLIRSASLLSQRGLILSDLVRGWLPLGAFHLVSPIFARHPLTRHDGLLSVRRAYMPQELMELAHAAGLTTAKVFSHFPWRMTLVWEKEPSSLPVFQGGKK